MNWMNCAPTHPEEAIDSTVVAGGVDGTQDVKIDGAFLEIQAKHHLVEAAWPPLFTGRHRASGALSTLIQPGKF
jgi:hypothetical protein